MRGRLVEGSWAVDPAVYPPPRYRRGCSYSAFVPYTLSELPARPLAAAVVATMRAKRVDAIHDTPIWRDRADFVIGARLPEGGRTEQLWVRQLSDQRFEICCIPFFLYDVALGDIVETNASYDLARVVERSGRSVFRVWFGKRFHPRQAVADELAELGALLEWSSANLLAVDAADEVRARVIAEYLAEQERVSRLTFETGRS